MNSLKQLVVVAIFAALTCAGLPAQSLDMQATIPFAFQAGPTLMPAGEYKVHGEGSFVIFTRVDGQGSTGVLTNSAWGNSAVRDARLDFTRYGDAYFLATVWGPFTSDGRQIPRTAREKELAKLSIPANHAVIVASNKK